MLKPTIEEDIDRVLKKISAEDGLPRSSCQPEKNGFTGFRSMGKDLKTMHIVKFAQGSHIPEKNGFTRCHLVDSSGDLLTTQIEHQ